MSTSQTIKSLNFLMAALFDLKVIGGFNYPLLIKHLYMIIIILTLIIEYKKKAAKQI